LAERRLNDALMARAAFRRCRPPTAVPPELHFTPEDPLSSAITAKRTFGAGGQATPPDTMGFGLGPLG
jgi:hypothetical protein